MRTSSLVILVASNPKVKIPTNAMAYAHASALLLWCVQDYNCSLCKPWYPLWHTMQAKVGG